ncbi:MAG: right-handed parallel beta-helix repeat-containing protein [Actinomycetes bacterium]
MGRHRPSRPSRIHGPRRSVATLAALCVGVGLLVAVPGTAQAAATFTVTDAGDGVATIGTLRWAIDQANNTPGADLIDFNLTGSSTITIASPLVVTDNVDIDAGSQLVTVTTESGGTGFSFDNGSAGSTLWGLIINGFATGVAVNDGPVSVSNNWFGVNAAGTGLSSSHGGTAVQVFPTAANAQVSANVIGNYDGGIYSSAASFTTIEQNAIGVTADGSARLTDLPTPGYLDYPLLVSQGSNVSVIANLIGGTNGGILADSTNSLTISDNYVGVSSDGLTFLDNNAQAAQIQVQANSTTVSALAITNNVLAGTGDGIWLRQGGPGSLFVSPSITLNQVGTAQGFGNTGAGMLIDAPATAGSILDNDVLNNGGSGIRITNPAASFAVEGNSIDLNAGAGIDLGSDGHTANDVNDVDTGPNDQLNAPDLSGPVGDSLGYSLDLPTGTTTARFEYFASPACDASGYGQGKTSIGVVDVPLDGNGDATGTYTIPLGTVGGLSATVTSTGSGGDLVTSEFSNCVPYGVPVNQVPFADSEGLFATAGQPFVVTLYGTDGNDDNLTFAIASTPSHGTLGTIGTPDCTVVLNECSADVTYTPDSGYSGTDSFTFTVDDGTATSPPGTISFTVAAASADLSVSPLVGTPDPVTGGGAVEYTTTVTNNGPDAAAGVQLKLNGDGSGSLPAFTTFVSGSASLSFGGTVTCTSTAGGPVFCPLGSIPSGSTASVVIYLRADAVASLTTTPVNVSVTSVSNDLVGANDSSSTSTTIEPASTNETTVFVPPSAQPQTVADAPTVLVGGLLVPVATSTDTTAASVTVPPNGPGGVVTVEEQPCQPPFLCTAAALTAVATPTGSLVNDVVVRFQPPADPFYDYLHPLSYQVVYDKSTVVGVAVKTVKVFYVKDGSPDQLLRAKWCGTITSSTVFPCLKARNLLKNRNPDVAGDLRIRLLATYDDPKIGTYK